MASKLIASTGRQYGIELRYSDYVTAFDGHHFSKQDTSNNRSRFPNVATAAGQPNMLSLSFQDRQKVQTSSQGWAPFGGVQYPSSFNAPGAWTAKTFHVMPNSAVSKLTCSALGASDSFGFLIEKVSIISAVPGGLIGFVGRWVAV